MNPVEIEPEIGAFMAKLDAALGRSMDDQPASCQKGCAHCCYVVIACGISEALWIAIEVARRPDWRDVARRLFLHAAEQTKRREWGDEWFKRHVPCPFLANDLCTIYERRPVACRAHFVQSPVENCTLGAKDPNTVRYDATIQCAHRMSKIDTVLFDSYPRELGPPFVGLFSHLVLWALQHCRPHGDRIWLHKRLETLPTPREWAERAVLLR